MFNDILSSFLPIFLTIILFLIFGTQDYLIFYPKKKKDYLA